MKYITKLRNVIFFISMASVLWTSCQKVQGKNSDTSGGSVTPTGTYTNPVFKPILADPTVVKDPNSDYFYAYGTEDYWSTDSRNHLVPIVRSKDLVNWNYVSDAFNVKPRWKASGGIWAPDIAIVNGMFHLYYSFSVWGDENPGIGLAISASPAGPFTDLGKLFLSNEIGVPNSIDPFYFEEGGKKYLFWGSYNNSDNQGTYAVELSDDGKSVKDLTQKIKIAAGDFEAVNIFKKDNYYYFLGSKNNCCNGAASLYQVQVARSRNLTGPYVDRNGRNITARGYGSLILQRNSKYAGPGHNARIITDSNGTDWMLYHAMDVNNAMIGTVNQRALMLDKVNWDADGWPKIHDGSPSSTKQPMPVFK